MSLCSSSSFLELSLSNLDLMLKTSAEQAKLLQKMKDIARSSSTEMAELCKDNPASSMGKLEAAEKRLSVALSELQRLKAPAAKFFNSLNDEQKAQLNNLVDWPGL